MPDYGCGGVGVCLLAVAKNRDDDDTDIEFVEVDPTGRYGRYKEVLGKGAFKTVYKAFDNVDGIEVAWNQVKAQDVLQASEDLERLYSEVLLLKTLKHKNIIKFYHSWVDTKGKNINFITEIFTSGTLRQYCKRHKHVDIKAVKNWSRQILRGLLYLHSHDPPIIHRDLKCDNIFVNGNQGEVKIGDLGLATILRQAHAAHSVIGTPEFMAPELYEEEYTELVDIYSFGMCLLEMVTSEYPYSECTNAAQIYKKVTLGKKPEALNKVGDPEVRKFIEKCLVTASKRLPARELLMDPFLLLEAGRDVADYLACISQTTRNRDMEDLQPSVEQTHIKPTAVKISYTLKESSVTPDDNCGTIPSAVTDLGSTAGHHCKPVSCSYPREERTRSVDFRVKGKRREDDTVFLRLRIADSEGHVRNIHFPFDIEGDTAMCVASEMVAELDLTDQDVTKIAEMIDAAILVLVPEWKPGVAIDETCGGELDSFPDHHLSTTLVEDGFSRKCSVFDPLSTVSSESSVAEQSPSCPNLWSDPCGVVASDATSPPRVEGTMHGRFEELTYHHCRPEFSARVDQEHCTVSSGSPDIRKGAVYWVPMEASPPASPVSLPESESAAMQSENCPSLEAGNVSAKSKELAEAFNELVESRRKAGIASYTHETWKGIGSGRLCVDDYAISAKRLEDSKSSQDNTQFLNSQPELSVPLSVDSIPNLHDDDELVAEELRMLVVKHEQELTELRRKHEEAVSEVKNRWWQKRSSSSLCASPSKEEGHSAFSQCDLGHSVQVEDSNKLQANDWQELATSKAMLNFHRTSSEKDTRKECESDRLSLKELTAVLSHVKVSSVGSVASSDDLSSSGQATQTVLKVRSQDGLAIVKEIVPDVDLISKCLIDEAGSLLKSESGVLSPSLNTAAIEQVIFQWLLVHSRSRERDEATRRIWDTDEAEGFLSRNGFGLCLAT